MVEFANQESLLEWLENQPRETQITLATKCALRALPAFSPNPGVALDQATLCIMRGTIISGSASRMPWSGLRDAAILAQVADIHFACSAADSVFAACAAVSAPSPHIWGSAAKNSADGVNYSADAIGYLGGQFETDEYSAARNTAILAGNKDRKALERSSPIQVFQTPLWPDGGIPNFFAVPYNKLKSFWQADPATWDFWERWYEGMLHGQPLDWALQRDVALIPNDVWEEGAEAVAQEIARIEENHRFTEPNKERLIEQARRLTAQPSLTAFMCKTIASEVQAATSINNLPPEFERLRNLPPILNLIEELSQSQERVSELEDQLAKMAGEVARLTRDLEAANGKTRADLFLDTATTSSAKILTTGFWAVLLGGASHFLGVVDTADLLGRFGLAVNELPLSAPVDAQSVDQGPKFLKPPK